MRAWLALAIGVCVIGSGCRKDEGLPSRPRAIELEDEAPAAAAPAPAPTPRTATVTRTVRPEPGGFPLPIAKGAKVDRQFPTVMAGNNELQQLVLRSARSVEDLASYYERALADAGYSPRRTGGERVLVQGRKDIGRAEVMVTIMRAPEGDASIVSITATRLVKP